MKINKSKLSLTIFAVILWLLIVWLIIKNSNKFNDIYNQYREYRANNVSSDSIKKDLEDKNTKNTKDSKNINNLDLVDSKDLENYKLFKSYKKAPISLDWVLDLRKLTKSVELFKSAKVSLSDPIVVVSQSTWNIANFRLENWDIIKRWALIATIRDTTANYWLNIDIAKKSLDSIYVNRKNELLTLEKNIEQASSTLKKSSLNTSYNIETYKKQLAQAEKNVEEINLDNTNTTRDIDISNTKLTKVKLTTSIKNLELSITNLKLQKDNTLNSISNSLEIYVKDIDSLNKDIINVTPDITRFIDLLFGITPENNYKNDDFETYLSAQNLSLIWVINWIFTEINNLDNTLLSYKSCENYNNTNKLKYNTCLKDSIKSNLNLIKYKLDLHKKLLDTTEDSLEESITNSNFTQDVINNYINQANSYQSQVNNITSKYTSLESNLDKILVNLDNTLENINNNISNNLNSIKNLEQDIINTENNILKIEELKNNTDKRLDLSNEKLNIGNDDLKNRLQNNIDNAIITEEQARDDLAYAKEVKYLATLKYNASIKKAQLEVAKSQNQAKYLKIYSPIKWEIVSTHNIFNGSYINAWSQIITIQPDNSQEIKLYLTKEEINLVKRWQKLDIYKSNKRIWSWTVSEISSIANSMMQYPVYIRWLSSSIKSWENVLIRLSFKLENNLVNINDIEIIEPWEWIVRVKLKNWNIAIKQIKLWKIWWDKIEIIKVIK